MDKEMKMMVYKSKNKKIIFDDWCDETEDKDTECDYWVYMCKECFNRYKNILNEVTISEGVSEDPLCSVYGCRNKNEYYIDFYINKNIIEFSEK